MKCPKCGREMLLKKQDFSYNFDIKSKKKYVRKMVWCMACDVWITIETPVVTK